MTPHSPPYTPSRRAPFLEGAPCEKSFSLAARNLPCGQARKADGPPPSGPAVPCHVQFAALGPDARGILQGLVGELVAAARAGRQATQDRHPAFPAAAGCRPVRRGASSRPRHAGRPSARHAGDSWRDATRNLGRRSHPDGADGSRMTRSQAAAAPARTTTAKACLNRKLPHHDGDMR